MKNIKDCWKVAVISDTHTFHNEITIDDDTDILIHCGDFAENSLDDFIDWFGSQKARYKILIAGNHDYLVKLRHEDFIFACNQYDIIYLEDSSIVLHGYKFYGTPWTPSYGGFHFMMDDLELAEIYEKIDEDTEILISHGPPFKILDKNDYNKRSGVHCGSKTLRERMKELKKLKYFFCGHIHESRGFRKYLNINCYNCANIHYLGSEPPQYVYIKKKENE